MRNAHLQVRCQWVGLRVENDSTPFTNVAKPEDVLCVPISHGEGNYYADSQTLRELEANNQIVFRYCTDDGEITQDSNPNGSVSNIAGITNAQGNVLGMMPHPERCCEDVLGGVDGKVVFESLVNASSLKTPAGTGGTRG